MIKITVKTNNNIISKSYTQKILLSDALSDMGIYQSKPCGGKGLCGKCKIIASGEMWPNPTDENVLACTTYAIGNVCIDYTSANPLIQGITDGLVSDFEKSPIISDGFGAALDIGTTTIAAYIFKFPECSCIEKRCVLNKQAEFGADVISRIEYANNGGLDKLRQTVHNQIQGLCDGYDIKQYVITGNTTMLHLLCGLNPHSLSVLPFEPLCYFGEWYQNSYLPRCISAHVGADITTAIIASGMIKKGTAFLVDIGTNGEMALKHNGKITCCSTAAGPAFEGAGISMGVPAISGAINKVYVEGNAFKYTTIDNKPAVGICGTGLIDAIACMVQLNIIDETGYLDEDYQIGDSNVYITAKDVRQLQLAKSAIRSGIDTLINHCGLQYNQIEAFYIAGGFGSFIDKTSAAKIGLIPSEIIEKVVAIGNGAGNGAAMILQSEDCLKLSENIAKNAKTIELATNPIFLDKYIDNMMF